MQYMSFRLFPRQKDKCRETVYFKKLLRGRAIGKKEVDGRSDKTLLAV